MHVLSMVVAPLLQGGKISIGGKVQKALLPLCISMGAHTVQIQIYSISKILKFHWGDDYGKRVFYKSL